MYEINSILVQYIRDKNALLKKYVPTVDFNLVPEEQVNDEICETSDDLVLIRNGLITYDEFNEYQRVNIISEFNCPYCMLFNKNNANYDADVSCLGCPMDSADNTCMTRGSTYRAISTALDKFREDDSAEFNVLKDELLSLSNELLNTIDKFLEEHKEYKNKYDVYINMNLTATEVTMDEAWEVVEQSPFGSGHFITYTGTMDCVPHTVPY